MHSLVVLPDPKVSPSSIAWVVCSSMRGALFRIQKAPRVTQVAVPMMINPMMLPTTMRTIFVDFVTTTQPTTEPLRAHREARQGHRSDQIAVLKPSSGRNHVGGF
jgi:hypothetical protein